MSQSPDYPDALRDVLVAAILAPGNRLRFLEAGLISPMGSLVSDWQAAFARLKPLTKAELRSQPGQFLTRATDAVFRGKTSGTQGKAFTYFAGERWNQQRIEARQRGLEQWGIKPTAPMLNLASRLFPVRFRDSSLVGEIDEAFLQTLLTVIKAKPVILRGYPSRLCEVAIALHHTQNLTKLSPVVAIIATGECLFEFQQKLLSQTFQAPVINEYGCQESGISGLSCPEVGRLHLDSDRCWYETVAGELLTTDLYNQVMPMVRYSSGDILKLFSEPCPCGRPGLTAEMLGRQEEAVVVRGEQHWPGAFQLPAFPGILSYQIQIHPAYYRLWVQPALGNPQPDLAPLKDWMARTLRARATECLIESPFAAPGLRDSYLNTIDGAVDNKTLETETWLHQVSNQPWSDWLNKPMSRGEAQEIAALLRQLVVPHPVVLQGLPPKTLQLFDTLMQSEVASNGTLEGLKIRVLLWTVGLIAGEPELKNLDVKELYIQLLERFQQWVDSQDERTLAQLTSSGFDLLAPLLTLDTPITQSLWSRVKTLIQNTWPYGLQADRFTLHHYLTILDQAGQKAQRQPHPWLPDLRPLAAILQGDISCFASGLSQELVAVWADIVHNLPGAFTTVPATTDFQGTWGSLRQALLQQNQTAVTQQLDRLFNRAQSPGQVAQCWLEKGYAALVFRDSLDPVEWIPILQQQMGLLGDPSSRQPQKAVSNPVPWIPILKALAPQLIEMGQPTLAYACLFAAAPPNRHLSNFDRQTQGMNGQQVNGKQSVISPWCLEA